MAEEILTDFEKDAMKEVGNIGSGNASARLSEYVNEKVDLELTEFKIIKSSELVNEYKVDEMHPVVSVFLRVTGDVVGSIITLFDQEFATRIVDLIDKKPIGTTTAITNDCEAKFRMIGQSLGESYVNAMVEFLNQDLKHSTPIVQINKKDIIMRFLLQGISPLVTQEVLLLNTRFSINKHSLKGEFIILFGLKSLDNFKEAINRSLGN